MTLTLRDLVVDSYANSVEKGFWDDILVIPTSPEEHVPVPVPFKYAISAKLALIHSEVSEALEELRDGDLVGDTLMRYTDTGKVEGFASELADIVIRTADLCGYLGIDLEAVLVAKMAYNKSRPRLHGRTM